MKTRTGEPKEYFDRAILIETDDCILWPYSTTQYGYGQMKVKGKNRRVTRLVLEDRGFYKSIEKSYVLHSCHNPSCINYRHLRYGSPKENTDDRERTGNTARGSRINRGHLTSEIVLVIREAKGTNKELGSRFGIAPNTVCLIKNRKRWGWL